jgi:hypothetical protein
MPDLDRNRATVARADAIASFPRHDHLDPIHRTRYSRLLATYDRLRLDADRGTAPGMESRLREVEHRCREMSLRLGLGDQLTDRYGFLLGDPSRILDATWQLAAGGW